MKLLRYEQESILNYNAGEHVTRHFVVDGKSILFSTV